MVTAVIVMFDGSVGDAIYRWYVMWSPGVRDGLTDLSLSTSVSEVDTAVSGEREDREEEQPPPPPPPPDALTSPQSSNLTSQHNTPASTQVCVESFLWDSP